MNRCPALPRKPGHFVFVSPRRSIPVLALLLVQVVTVHAFAAQPKDPSALRPSIYGLMLRMDQFLHAEEVAGVTRETRSLGYPAEEIRLTVVPQLLGYRELYRAYPSPVHYRDIVERADYLLQNLALATAGGATDGMLACALLAAWEVTGDGRYRAAAQPIIDRALVLSGFQARLNWGLMSAMALAEYSRLTQDPVAAAKAREIVSGAVQEQAGDGSFPHYCPGTRDIHYSAWMSMELILIARSIADPVLEQALARVSGFLHERVDSLGMTRYEGNLASGVAVRYYSRGSGCGIDYDTRGWINELGYLALLFGKRGDSRFDATLDRLRDLEDRGAFADKWDYFPSLEDPIYPWASAQRSVIRTSVIFWSLACLYAEPSRTAQGTAVAAGHTWATAAGGAPEVALAVTEATPPPEAGAGSVIEKVSPNPTSGDCQIQLGAYPPGEVRIEIFDPSGRRVRALDPGTVAGRGGTVRWDGRDERGTRVGRGLYFVRGTTAGRATLARIVVTD